MADSSTVKIFTDLSHDVRPEAAASVSPEISTSPTPTAVPTADLALLLSAWPSPVLIGQDLMYTITVQNLGPSAAQSVLLTDAVPSAVHCLCYSLDGASVWQPWPGVLALGTLASGAASTVHLRGITRGCPTTGVTNTATVSASTSDPNPTNNTASVTTTVLPLCGRVSTIVPDAYSQRFSRYLNGTEPLPARRTDTQRTQCQNTSAQTAQDSTRRNGGFCPGTRRR